MIDFSKLKLEKLLFEVKYIKGFVYLDQSGIVINNLIDKYSEFKSFSVGNINEGVTLVAYNPDIVINFRFDRTIVDIQFPEKSELEHFLDICDATINIVSNEFDVHTFTRVGNRFIYIHPFDDVKEANDLIFNEGPFVIDKDKLSHFGNEITHPEFKVVVSDEDVAYIIKLSSTSDRKHEMVKRPYKIDLSDFTQHVLEIDIDFYTKKEVDYSVLDCSEMIKGNLQKLKKLIPSLFKR